MPGASSDQTRGVGGQPHPPPIWSCSGWGLPSEPVSRPLVRSYRTVAPLPPAGGGIFSVALALGSPPLGVTQHPALRSSDFPREPPCGHVPATALLTRVVPGWKQSITRPTLCVKADLTGSYLGSHFMAIPYCWAFCWGFAPITEPQFRDRPRREPLIINSGAKEGQAAGARVVLLPGSKELFPVKASASRYSRASCNVFTGTRVICCTAFFASS